MNNFAALAPHLPMVHTGPERQDDRRIISGIVHRFREGCRWRALPEEYGPYTTVFNRYNRWSRRGLWQRLFAALVEHADPPALVMIDSSAAKAHRSASGAQKGVRRPSHRPLARRPHDEIHAIVDTEGRPRAFLLTGGNVADIKGAAPLLASIGPSKHTIADKGYDADHLRSFLDERGTEPVIPNKSRPGASREGGDLLVPDVDPLDFALSPQGVGEAIETIADNAVNPLDARGRKGLRELISYSCHVVSPSA